MATGLSLADPSSLNYAKLRWRDPNTRGFLRTLAKAMQKVLTLSRLLAQFHDKTHVDFQNLDAILPGISF